MEDTNRNKASQDHINQQISTHRRDTFTPANDLALGNKNDHLVGLLLHDDSIKIQATMDTSLLNCNNGQDTISQVDSLGLADYQHKQEVQKLSQSIGLSSEADCLLRDSTTTMAEGPSSSRHSISQTTWAQNPHTTSNSVDTVLNSESPSPNSSLKCSPAENQATRCQKHITIVKEDLTVSNKNHTQQNGLHSESRKKTFQLLKAYYLLGRIVLDM